MATVVKSKKVGQKFDTAEDVLDIVFDIRENESTLETLNLQGNSYGIEAATAIGEALELCHNLKYLELDDMFISRLKTEIPECLNAIFRGVMNAGAQIHTLNLNDNAIGPVTMPALLPFLSDESCCELQVLKLNNCGLGTKGGQMLAEVLSSKNNLKQLVIGRNRLEIDGIRAISESLSQISSLEILELPQNGTKYEGIIALCEAIKANPNLRILNVNDNVLRTTHKDFGNAVSLLDKLETLDLGDCLLKSKGACSIFEALIKIQERTQNSVLKEVIMSGNEIGPSAVEFIKKFGQVITHEMKLNLNSNCFGSDSSQELERFFGGSPVIITIEDDDEEGENNENDEEEQEDTSTSNEPEIVDVEKLCELYMMDNTETLCEKFYDVTSSGLNASNHQSLTDGSKARAEAIIRVLTKRHSDFLDKLLVSCGLIKGEDKRLKSRVNEDLTGALLAISNNIKSFDSAQQNLIKVFVDKKLKEQKKYDSIRTVVMNNIYSF